MATVSPGATKLLAVSSLTVIAARAEHGSAQAAAIPIAPAASIAQAGRIVPSRRVAVRTTLSSLRQPNGRRRLTPDTAGTTSSSLQECDRTNTTARVGLEPREIHARLETLPRIAASVPGQPVFSRHPAPARQRPHPAAAHRVYRQLAR